MAFIAVAQAGDGQTTATNPLSITIPSAAAAGQAAVLYVDIGGSQTCATPTGWTLLAGPTDVNAGNATAYAFGRNLQSGDPGTSVSLDLSAAARVVAEMQVFSDQTVTGAQVATPAVQTTATGTYVVPTLTGVAAGSMLSVAFLRRRSGASGNITVTTYTESAATDVGTAYGTGVNVFATTGYLAGSGSVGGESAGSSGVTSIGVVYLIALPQAQADATIPVPTAFVPARTQDVTAVADGTQQVPSAFVPVRTRDVEVTASATQQVPSALVTVAADPVEPGTAVPVPTAIVEVWTRDVEVTSDTGIAVPTALVPAHANPVTQTSSSSPLIPSAVVSASSAAPTPASYYRFQWWDGSQWRAITPVVWNGVSWAEIAVTLTDPD